MRGAVLVIVMIGCAHRRPPDDLTRAKHLFEEGHYLRAAALYDRVFAEHGLTTAEDVARRAAIDLLTKDFVGCLAFADRGLVRFPDEAHLLQTRAACLWSLDRKAEALVAAEAAVARDPAEFAAQMIIAEATERTDPRRAVRAFRDYLAHRPEDLAPSDVRIHLRTGFALLNVGDAAAAVVELDIAREDPRGRDVIAGTRGLCIAHALLHDATGAQVCETVPPFDWRQPE
jgi:hypothetical protein